MLNLVCFSLFLLWIGMAFNAEMLLCVLFVIGFYVLNFLIGELLSGFLLLKINKIFKRFVFIYSIHLKGLDGWLVIIKKFYLILENLLKLTILLLNELVMKNKELEEVFLMLYKRILFINIVEFFIEGNKILYLNRIELISGMIVDSIMLLYNFSRDLRLA